jgi:predicted O-linked N-acetylglucosamine transferase (SPINDLY family)
MSPQIVFFLNKALECLRNSSLDSAELYLNQAIKLEKNNPHIIRLLGVVFAQRKQYSEALQHINKSILLFPKNALALSNLGNIHLELGEYEKALDAYDKALKIDRNYEEAWSNKGNALFELKRYEEALTHYDKALNIRPDYAEAWSNKGNSLFALKRFDTALTHYDKALDIRPDYAEGWGNKANLLMELNFISEAILHYEKAINTDSEAKWLYGSLINAKMKICDWTFYDEIRNNILSKIKKNEKASFAFTVMALTDDAMLIQKASNTEAKYTYPPNSNLGPIPKRPKRKKIRIGYFSSDFQDHPVSHLTSELFEIHDRNQFEIIAFSLNKAPPGDKKNAYLRNIFDKFIDADEISNEDVASLSRKLEIDIAIDLTGPTKNGRPNIFSYRAAPIQVNWLGFPGTFGTDFIDYIIADKTIIPDQHREFYNEKVAYLPDTYMVDDSNRVASAKIFTKEECGLPENKFIYSCFNNFYKFNPSTLDSWSRILLAVENSIVWLSESNLNFQVRLTKEFERRGIESSRIVFARREDLMSDHLARYRLADLFIDTSPYNAHTTAIDSLKSGVPVITIIGESFPARVAASLLHAIGLPELITKSQEEYEALAISLAKNPEKLAEVKAKLVANRFTTPLFNTPLFTKNIEAAYKKMYGRYQADLPPDHFFVS